MRRASAVGDRATQWTGQDDVNQTAQTPASPRPRKAQTLAAAFALQPWVLISAGAATVVEAKLSSAESYLALFLFCVLASASYLSMEIYAGFKPGKSQAFLTRLRTWIDTHTDQVIISLSAKLS